MLVTISPQLSLGWYRDGVAVDDTNHTTWGLDVSPDYQQVFTLVIHDLTVRHNGIIDNHWFYKNLEKKRIAVLYTVKQTRILNNCVLSVRNLIILLSINLL